MGVKSIIVGIVAVGGIAAAVAISNPPNSTNATPVQQWNGNVNTQTGGS